MTVLVGIKCSDGVVIGTDSASTFSAGTLNTIEQASKKVEIIDDRIVIAGTGAVGLNQRFCSIIKSSSSDKLFSNKTSALDVAKSLSRSAIDDFLSTHAGNHNAGIYGQTAYGALVAFPLGSKFELCEFQVSNFQPELKDNKIWYVSMGSGQYIADPFLGLMRQVFWEDGLPACSEGIFATTWAIQHAIDLNCGGINGPIQIAVLSSEKKGPLARLLSTEEIAEHQQNVEEAKSHLREYSKIFKEKAGAKQVPTISQQ